MADGDHHPAPLKFGADKRFREGIIAMALSPRHDLLALATEASQVLLHRYEKLERVWVFEKIASFENNRISTLCWRDDGHVLAIAYYIDGSDAFYKLLDVRTGQSRPVDTFPEFDLTLPAPALSMMWSFSAHECRVDERIKFFGRLPEISKTERDTDIEILVTRNTSILVMVLKDESIMGFGFGIVPIFSLQFDDFPVRAFLKRDFSEMVVMCQHDQKEMKQKVVKMHSVKDNLEVIHRYCTYVIAVELTIIYLQACMEEMRNTWNHGLGPLTHHIPHEMADHFLMFYLSGIKSTKLIGFLKTQLPLEAYKKVVVDMANKSGLGNFTSHPNLNRNKYVSLQKLSLVNFMQASDKLYALINTMSSFCRLPKLFELLAPEHVLINFEYIETRAAELVLKNTMFLREMDDLFTCAEAFSNWLILQYEKLDPQESAEQKSEQAEDDRDEELIMRFLQVYVASKRDNIMDYLNSEPMQPNESARNMAESPWEKFIDTHGFSQHIIQKDDPQVSLKTALDYVRRLFVKYCFRQDDDSFGSPKSRLTDALCSSIFNMEKFETIDDEPICQARLREANWLTPIGSVLSKSHLFVLRYDEMDDAESIPLNYSEAFRLNPEFKALDFDIYRFHAETEMFEGFALEVSVEDETLHRLTHYEFSRERKDECPKVKSFVSLHNNQFSSLELSPRRSLIALHSSEANIVNVYQLKDDDTLEKK